MSDIAILKQMFLNSVIEPLIPDHYNPVKRQVILKEPDSDYSIPILGMPSDSEVVVIKTDAFKAPNHIFQNSKHECKRADFVIISNTEKQKVIVFIELKAKSTTSKEYEIIQQLKGAKCFVTYFQEIGKLFWEDRSFLDNYDFCYVTIRNIGISKLPSRIKSAPTHNQPEKMLKIGSPHYLQFNHLI